MQVLDQKERKARKEHKCYWCSGLIKIGEKYNWSKQVYDGELYEWKSHIHCLKVASRFDMFDWCDEGLSESDFCDQVTDLYSEHIQGDDDETTPSIAEQVLALFNMPEDKS